MTERTIPKSCSTCEHRNGSRCQLSGYYMTTERKMPSECGQDFTGWAPRLGLTQRIAFWWRGSPAEPTQKELM